MYKGIYDYVEITDIKDLLGKSEAKYGDKPAFKFKTNVPEKTVNYISFSFFSPAHRRQTMRL